MVIDPATQAAILRLFQNEKWKKGTIAAQLGVHHSVVTRVLAGAGTPPPARSSKLDPFLPFMIETLQRYPRLCASRLQEMCRERGYVGGASHFRDVVSRLRPTPPAEAYLRLRTLPGEQAQVDWAHFGKVVIGRAERALVAFVMVLAYSRRIFLRFFLGMQLENFLRGHVAAFEAFGGVSRSALYDNLKSCVLERAGDAIRFHPQFAEFAAHYGFEPRPVAVGRGNEKGRVERAIGYVRTNFFAGRSIGDLDVLNGQALDWSEGPAMDRRWPEDHRLTVREAFAQERAHLRALPADGFPVDERREVAVGKTPYVRFDLNDYSVPHEYVRRTLVVQASLDSVRVLAGGDVIATHRRSFDKGEQIEDPEHIERLAQAKGLASRHRGIDVLYRAVPGTQALLVALGERGENLSHATRQLRVLLAQFGAPALETAVRQAVAKGAPHPHAVRHILEQDRRSAGLMPTLVPALPSDPRVRDLVVEPHPLSSYDAIAATGAVAGEQADEPS